MNGALYFFHSKCKTGRYIYDQAAFCTVAWLLPLN